MDNQTFGIRVGCIANELALRLLLCYETQEMQAVFLRNTGHKIPNEM